MERVFAPGHPEFVELDGKILLVGADASVTVDHARAMHRSCASKKLFDPVEDETARPFAAADGTSPPDPQKACPAGPAGPLEGTRDLAAGARHFLFGNEI